MLEYKDSKVVRSNPIVNRVRKPRDDVLAISGASDGVAGGLHDFVVSTPDHRT